MNRRELIGTGVAAVWGIEAGRAAAAAEGLTAEGYERRTIYHSPQSPGYTSWVGAWAMPDGSLMTCFTQATGPLDGRPRVSDEIVRKRGWQLMRERPSYDFTGLELANVYLRSRDQGKTWEKAAEDPFQTAAGQMSQGGGQIALKDGSILRSVFGYHLPLNPELPQTGYTQRSTDGGKTWGKPRPYLDPEQVTARITRFRRLRDGRLVGTGGFVPTPSSAIDERGITARWRPLLLVSENDGATWQGPIPVVPEALVETWGGEEWDTAELPNGDLLAVFRRMDPEMKKQVRWRGLLKKEGKRWVARDLGPAPFPHSGHPELLVTREGAVLHVATTGIDATADGGKSWQPVRFSGLPDGYHANYYPKALQLADGRILVFAHVGTHNGYGDRDQSVTMDSFRLERAVGTKPDGG